MAEQQQKTLDPVCGMQLDAKQSKFSAQHEGHKWNFCSQACMKKFQHSPSKYASAEKPKR